MGSSVAGKGIPFLSSIEDEYQLNTDMAKATEADARYNASQRRKAADQMMGEQIASFGASGVELEGTPTEIITDDRKVAEQEAMNIIYSGKLKSWEMKRRSSLQRRGAYEQIAAKGGMLAVKGGV